MYSDSDTESDSGASDVANTQEPYSSLPCFSSTPAEKPWIGRDVENAVEELGALDIGESDPVSYQECYSVKKSNVAILIGFAGN